MREALRDSIAGALRETVTYPKGSIVICTSCAKPIFRLERGISAGEKAGRAASAFKPLSIGDMIELQGRAVSGTADAGVIAALRMWTLAQVTDHVKKLHDPKAGDPMVCPACGDVFPQARAAEVSDTQDRAYVVELITVPPRAVCK
jgi:hypothetical protein